MMRQDRHQWASSLDKFCMVTGALLPIGIIVGNVAFEAVIALVDIAWIIRWVLAKDSPFQKKIILHPLILPWMLWFGTIIISLLIHGQGILGWAHDVVYIRYLFFVAALIDVSHRLPVQKYLIIGLGAGAVWATLNILSAYTIGYDLFGRPLIRYVSKLKESARIAGLFAYVAPFFLGWAVLDKTMAPKQRVLVACVGMLALALVVQTQIRTALLASAVGIAAFFAYLIYKKSRWAMILLTLIFAGCVTLVLPRIESFTNLSSTYDRIYIWKVALQMWQDNPLFGVGVASFQEIYQSVAASGIVAPFSAPDGKIVSLPEAMHAHNLFLMLLACNGVTGLCMFLWLFVNAVRWIFTRPDGWRFGLIAWPVVVMVIGLTGWNIYHGWYQAVFAYFIVLVGCRDGEGKMYVMES
ncbi:MAG: O-antigen ligase family protein [Deltaproteobacteria bacterium]|nr:O-antigen ligase family protein [Deltaproteobacteria bacterium]